MASVYRVLLTFAMLVFLLVAGICIRLFVYTGDLPDIDHLSQFAPSVQSVVSDSCLPGVSKAIPLDHIAQTFKDALASAEPTSSLSNNVATSLMCNRSESAGMHHLSYFRLSWHIRSRFSEQELFTIYANRAYFGAGIIGIENASKQFFGKSADTLTVEQAALLAGLLRAPGLFSPKNHPDNALKRRNKVLEAMVVQGRLTATKAARAETARLPSSERVDAESALA